MLSPCSARWPNKRQTCARRNSASTDAIEVALSERKKKENIMAKQRISYVPLEKMDAEMRKEMERCQREGTPRPESSAVRAHVRACVWFFASSWRGIFRN